MTINATAVWRVRPSGSNTNGGGYDAAISGAGTDYSRQNAAQASGSNATAAQNSTTFVDATANAFTSLMVGNAIWIASGTNFIAGAYFVTAFTSASTVTLDRAPATAGAGSVGVWKLGGGWADPRTNMTSALNAVQPGNTIFVLGSGVPNPASYTFDYTITTSAISDLQDGSANGRISWRNDPATPSYKAPPDTTGGMPVIKYTVHIWRAQVNDTLEGLWFVSGATGQAVAVNCTGFDMIGLVFDQVAQDSHLADNATQFSIIGCECFASVSTASTAAVLYCSSQNFLFGCNIHNISGPGILIDSGNCIDHCIIAKCGGDGIFIEQPANTVVNCTIDGNTGNGVVIDQSVIGPIFGCNVLNNIISNHTGAGKAGLVFQPGTAAANALFRNFLNYNSYYNNTSNVSGIAIGPNDTQLAVDPYFQQSVENYTLR